LHHPNSPSTRTKVNPHLSVSMSYLQSSYQSSFNLSKVIKDKAQQSLQQQQQQQQQGNNNSNNLDNNSNENSSETNSSVQTATFAEWDPVTQSWVRSQKVRPSNVLTDLNAPTPIKASLPLPDRFTQPELWARHTDNEELHATASVAHPFYRTSNAVYGGRIPTHAELPNKYYGHTQSFTSKFPEGKSAPSSAGLNCTTTKSRVLKTHELGFM
jgi:hypothetical protein